MAQTIPTVERLLTQPEAAERCGVHLHTIIRARRAGELRYVQIGRAVRIRELDLAAWLNSHTVGGDS
jgi:excisionase family DNA binding protein